MTRVKGPEDIEDISPEARRALADEMQTQREAENFEGAQDFNDVLTALGTLPGGDATDIEVEEHEKEQRREAAIDVLQGLRSMQGADEIRWRIYRTGHEDPKKNGYLTEIPTTQLSFNWVRDHFGGGTFRVRGYNAGGKYTVQRTLYISEDAPRKVDVVPGQSGSGFNMMEWMAAQSKLDEQRRTDDERRRREERDEAERNRKENKALMIALAGPLSTVLAAMFGNKGPDLGTLLQAVRPAPGPSVTDLIAGLASLKNLEPKPAREVDPLDKAFKIMELIQSKTPSGGDDTGWFKDVLKMLAPAAPELLKAAMTARPPVSVVPNATPSSTGHSGQASLPGRSTSFSPSGYGDGTPGSSVPGVRPIDGSVVAQVPNSGDGSVAIVDSIPVNGASAESSPNEDSEMNLLTLRVLPWFKAQLGLLLTRASRNVSVATCAEMFLSDFPDGINPDLVMKFIEAPEWWSLLTTFEPNVANYQPWFVAFRATLLELVSRLRQEAAAQDASNRKSTQKPLAEAGQASVASSGTESERKAKPDPSIVERPMAIPSLGGGSETGV